MGTTVWIGKDTRQDLRRLQDQLGTPSVNATIRRLLERPAPDARALFAIHRAGIMAVIRRRRLKRLVAFGSRARGDARATSDLDLAVEVKAGADPLTVLEVEADLEELLGIRVHIVELPNPALRQTIQREGVAFEA